MTSLQNIISPILQNQDVIASQKNIGVLRVTGFDSRKFLQGQITCDINKLSPDHGLYGAICSVKGRIISSFYLVQENDDVLMLMSKDLIEKTLLHLKKYAVFFKTELIDSQNTFAIQTRITSEHAETSTENVSDCFITTRDNETITLTLCHNPIRVQWIIISPDNTMLETQNEELAALTILAARPLITLEQSETVLPQWLNMQSTGGISFTKGCYTGQEIVARMQYRGKSKKQLALAKWEGQLDSTKDIIDEQGKSIGQVFAVTNIHDSYFAQIILNSDPSELERIQLDQQEITLLPLPYSLEIKK